MANDLLMCSFKHRPAWL